MREGEYSQHEEQRMEYGTMRNEAPAAGARLMAWTPFRFPLYHLPEAFASAPRPLVTR